MRNSTSAPRRAQLLMLACATAGTFARRQLAACALAIAALVPAAAFAASPNVVISQVYGAGGNSNATYNADYVELFNTSSVAVDVSTWSVQYTSAAGTGNFGANASNLVALTGSIPAGGYYLVAMTPGTTGADLPTADATGTIAMAAGAGKVALVTTQSSLGCNGSSTVCTAEQLAKIVDLVGYGTGSSGANFYEGSGAAPTIDATHADFRADSGCTDTDDNAADFAAAAPAPRNSASATHACSAGSTPTLSIDSVNLPEGNAGTTAFTFTVTLAATPASTVTINYATADGTATAPSDYTSVSGTLTFDAGTSTLTQSITVLVNGDTNPEPDETFTVTLSAPTNATLATATGTGTIQNDDFASLTIMQIQGHGAASPYAGQPVVTEPASSGIDVVTAVDTNGFFVQDSVGDGDATTSDAVFVFTYSAPTVAVGDAVTVAGTVAEYSGSTEITSPVVTVLSHGNSLPAAYDISGSTNDPTTGICTSGASTIDPLTDGYQASNFACLDGMLVTMPQAIVNAPTFGSGGSGIKADTVSGFYIRPASVSRVFRKPGLMFPAALNVFPTGYDSSTYAGPVFNGEPELVEVYLPGLLGSTDIAALPNGGIYNSETQLSVTGIVQGYQASGTHYPIYEIYPRPAAQTTTPDVILTADAPSYPVPVADPVPGTLTIGSQNMLHFFNNTADGADTSAYNDTCAGTGSGDTCPTADQYAARLLKMSLQIRTVLKAPAIQVVQEAENYSVMQALAAQMTTDDASVIYHPYLIPGNDPGGINIGVLARDDVTVNSVTQLYEGTTTSACSSGSSCLLNDRPPVLVDATFNGSYHVRVLAIYNRSLLNLGTNDYVGQKRRAQAEQVACIVQALQTTGANVDCDANNPGAAAGNAQQDASGTVTNGSFNVVGDATVPVVIVGDFNAYEFSDGYVDSTGIIMGTADTDSTHSVYPPTASYIAPSPVLFDTGSAANPADHYSYTYDGFAQEIDHILLTSVAQADFVQISNAHGNADVSSSSTDATIVDTSTASADTARRSSDHDGQVVTLGYVVTPVVNGDGTISPATAQTISSANPVVFTVTPNAGSQISVIDTCGSAGAASGSFDSATNTYTIPAGVNTNCSVTASFTYTVTVTGGMGGTVTGPTQSQVIAGQSTTFTVDPLTGYAIGSIVGDTCTPSLLSGDTWTTGTITQACAITVTFSVSSAIDGSCGTANGGSFTSLDASSPNLCSAGTVTGFTGTGPWSWSCAGIGGGTDSETCSASIKTWTVSTTGSGAGGTVSAPASTTVNNGDSTTFSISVNGGYSIASVSGDSCSPSVQSGSTWTTGPITADCTISVSFARVEGFVPLHPSRILDTRTGAHTSDGQFAAGGALTPGQTLDLTVLDRGGVPASGVKAVVLNLTVTAPTASGHITAWASGAQKPATSNFNFVAGQTIPNLVIVGVGSNGKVSLFNSNGGNTHLVADVQGYFTDAADLTTVAPVRLLDTRSSHPTIDGLFAGTGAVSAGDSGTVNLTVAGRGGLPNSGVSTVILNVTVTNPTAPAHITVWPTDNARPTTSNLNFVAGQTIANLVVSKVSADGKVSLFNSAGSTDLIADVMGWFPNGSELTSLQPARLLDNRPTGTTVDGQFQHGGPLGPQATLDFTVAGRGGVPASGVGAVVLNVTVTQPTAPGYVTVWPTGSAQPLASNLNFTAGLTIPNLVIVKVGDEGKVSLYNSQGNSYVIADVVGWFPASE
ncbi:MAG: Calx-beta domain-containing protein [Rudaea sp.]|uniref:Calx-beta domain-containing protein n=1 Tax=Rudaea sp. TaxID=2136325 RepID=UPI0039E2BF25